MKKLIFFTLTILLVTLAPRSFSEVGAQTTCIDNATLISHITDWKAGTLSMPALMQTIASWKAGTGCDTTTGGLTPIARWDVVPYQRINTGETLNLGVIAFSKAGIDRVEFHISGRGYNGGIKSASQMTYNPQSKVFEYWVPLRASEFSSDGTITVEAIAYGEDGGIRNKNTDGGGQGLDPLVLTVNPGGSLAQIEAWVDAAGNDTTGVVSNSNLPFATIGKAISAIAAANGGEAGGGIVRLKPGTHIMSRGGIGSVIPATNEWVTITTAIGGTKSNTILRTDQSTPKVKLLRFKGITLQSSGQYTWIYTSDPADAKVWADGSDLIGSGRWLASTYPIRTPAYFTDCYITGSDTGALFAIFARGLTIEHIGNDAFQNVEMVVNTTADDIDPGATGNHADAFQLHWVGGGPKGNVIVYGYRATNFNYQSIFVGDVPPAPFVLNGAAIVNSYFKAENPVAAAFNVWGISTNHLLIWNNTHLGDALDLRGAQSSNVSLVGNVFNSLEVRYPATLTEARTNHFVSGTTWGSGASSGLATLDTLGRPTAASNLREKVSPSLVIADQSGTARGATSDIGAYEYTGSVPPPTTCTSFTYSDWTPTTCPVGGTQTRTVISSSPAGCTGGNPILSQSCTPESEPEPPSTNGLVLQLPFEGNANDSSGSGNNGTIVGSLSYATGRIGQALSFNGNIANYLDLGIPSALALQGNFTVSAWVKPTSFSDARGIIKRGSRWTGSAAGALYQMTLEITTGGLSFSSRGDKLQTGIYLSPNVWTHVACSVDGTETMRCYKDGVTDSVTKQRTILGAVADDNSTYVGRVSGSSAPFLGEIDDVRIYNRALSANEIQTLYNQSTASKTNTNNLASILQALKWLIGR